MSFFCRLPLQLLIGNRVMKECYDFPSRMVYLTESLHECDSLENFKHTLQYVKEKILSSILFCRVLKYAPEWGRF